MGLTRNAKLLAALFILVALIGGAYVVGSSGSSVDKFLTWLDGVGISPTETDEQLLVFSGDHNGGQLYDIKNSAYNRLEVISKGDLIDYTRTVDHSVSGYLFRPENELYTQVVIQESAGESKFIQGIRTIKSGLRISDGGSQITYAELREPVEGMLYTPDASQWVVTHVDIEKNLRRVLGVGVAPYFVTEDGADAPVGVIFSSPEGLVFHSLVNFEQTIISDFRTSRLDRATAGSQDGRHVAVFSPVTGTYALFDLYQTNPPRLTALGGLLNSYESIAMTDDTLYGLSRISGEYKLFKHSFDEPRIREEIFTFPETINPTRLIP